MTTAVHVCDAIHANITRLPSGPAAGYTTGSADIRWTAADWAAHPGAVRIDQDPSASDACADVLDVERGAASPGDCPGWVRRARQARAAGTRPGQRAPAVYMSRSAVSSVVTALSRAGLRDVGLWVADWNRTASQAATEVVAPSGPYPVIGVQYRSLSAYDVSVFSSDWLGSHGGGDWTEEAIMALPTLAQGDTDTAGHVFYVHRAQALTRVIGQINTLPAAAKLATDGTFGPETAEAVKAVQRFFGITVDSTVGPVTWRHLIGG